MRLLSVPLLPAVCMAHGAALVWLHEKASGSTLFVIMLVLVALAAIPLGGAAVGLWFWDSEDGAVFAALASCGLMAGYFCTLVGAELWMLQWWGVETTCTVRHVMDLGGATPDASSPVVHYYDLDCAAAAAPDTMRTMSYSVEPGQNIPVVYDPGGNAGATPENHVDDGGNWAWGTGIVMAVWAVPTLTKTCLELRRPRRV